MEIFDITFLVFIIILIGLLFGLRRKEKNLNIINGYVLYVALPLLFLKVLT